MRGPVQRPSSRRSSVGIRIGTLREQRANGVDLSGLHGLDQRRRRPGAHAEHGDIADHDDATDRRRIQD